MKDIETQGEFIPQGEIKLMYQAVIALTLPPRGQQLVGTCMRIDVNGQVAVFDSEAKRMDTLWRTDKGHLYAVPNVIMQSDTVEELRADIHKRVDKVFDGWLIAFPTPVIKLDTVPPFEQQPASEALTDLAKTENPEIKTVDITIESTLSPAKKEIIDGNK